jgi:hypothetical protein
MRYWWREAAGWALVLLGLLIFSWAIVLLTVYHAIFDTGPMVIAGIFVFRGGIHLLKVAVAARICAEAVEAVKKRK